MSHFASFRTCVAVCTTLLLAGPVLATTSPGGKRSVARRPHPVQAAAKAAAACCATAPAKANGPTAPLAAAQIAATPTEAPAATQVIKLNGIVLNADGTPCPGASVYPAGAPRQLVITDAKGAFALPVPAGSAVSVRIEYFGVGSSRVEVATPSAEVLHITLGQ